MNPGELQRFKVELAGTAAAMGKDLSDVGIRIFAEDLSPYPLFDALEALKDCRRTLTRFPTVADLIVKIESKDGRPGAEEAWALIPKDEFGSVVWSDEMAGAYGIAHPLLLAGDEIAARMAFKEKYTTLVKHAREKNTPARWTFSGGTDPSSRAGAIQLALVDGRISPETAAALGFDEKPQALALPSPDPVGPQLSPEEVKAQVQALIASIKKPLPGAE